MADMEEVIVNDDPVYWCRPCVAKQGPRDSVVGEGKRGS